MFDLTTAGSVNPLLPTALDGATMSIAIVGLVLALAALASLLAASSPTGWPVLAWALVVLFVPFVGPVSWFAARRRERLLRFRDLDHTSGEGPHADPT
ncbi:PLDc N-terminal domain-containing protein [Curtobacterium sp. A7_M15]|uniref:PLDc N-terminal domain-containing protein n=1 Tax=Curtobacterium sp. A7_M15 TaxID=3065241 RepID=UPI002737D314|nr:PLDc N-terminal domain-containing protein [Curtobacterium sp. A7_M15]MDP4331889.1 PLDc N-terminal domain-containing protein [Curtobacterium sp. A7_M15]